MGFHPHTELVAIAWLKTVTGIPAGQVNTTLPADTSTWSTNGFVQVSVTGGSPQIHLRVAEPVVMVDCWTVNPNGSSPPWGRANQLAECVRAAAWNHTAFPATVTLPTGYNQARVMAAWLVTEPRRMPEDDASYARYTFDLAMNWIEVPA